MTGAIVSPAGCVYNWGALTAATGRYLYLGGLNNATAAAGESVTWFRVPRAGVFRNMYAEGGAATTVTLRVNGADSALTISFPVNTLTSDLTHTVAVAAGDYVSMHVTGTAGSDCRVYVEFI
jgi:hypothetical protein